MEQWKEYRLGEICESVSESYRGKAEKVVLINTSDVLEGECLNHSKVPNKELKGQFKKTFKENDILYSEIRPVNRRYAYIDFFAKDYIASTKLMVLRHNEKVLPKYLYYILQSKDMIEELQMLAEARSGTFPQITFDVLSKECVMIPNINTQEKILAILTSLDNKIQLNRKINSNLEEQAKALFKSWFIDFEPFKGGKFVDSELGKIPEGWEVCPLEQMGKFKRGKTIVAKNTKEGTVPVVAGGMEPAYYNNVANTKGPVITVSASGANAGFMRLYFQDIWASDCSFLDNTNENLLWIYCFLDNNRRVLRHAQTGAVQPHVKPADINSILVCVPVHELIDKFQNVVRPLFLTIGLLQSETMRLQRTRDTLLPKLMSGEIKV